MARLIDADAFLEKMKRTSRYFDVVFDVEEMPTVDAVEVVRCEKCRKRHTWECAMHYESDDGKEQYGWENDNDFCSWGERKDGDK